MYINVKRLAYLNAALLGGVLAGVALFLVWPIDIISNREIIVCEIQVRPTETVQLTQLWVGDGYLTRIKHKSSGPVSVKYAVGDPDAAKLWRCKATIVSNYVQFKFSGRLWRYDYGAKTLFLENGACRRAD